MTRQSKIVRLGDIRDASLVGNKAYYLSVLKEQGFQVPAGIVVDCNGFYDTLEHNQLTDQIQAYMNQIKEDTCDEVVEKIGELTKRLMLSDAFIEEFVKKIDLSKKYAVRSSGIKEDLSNYSFAGQYQTYINVCGRDELIRAIIGCYQGVFSKTVLSYLVGHELSVDALGMAVIIEEMVDSHKSGVVFTINPMTGDDKEMVIEATSGQGENLVSGKVRANRYHYNWFKEEITLFDEVLLSREEVLEIAKQALAIQKLFGYPCDIEFAIHEGKLYILQARAITKVMYTKIKDQWTTADFKDGGVSATVCTPFMWSLYEYIWEHEFRNFLVESSILKASQLGKLGEMFYGRPYWNLSIGKAAMSKVPGYKEREFDHELGVKITYEGDGYTTKISLKSIFEILRIALKQKKIVAHRTTNAQLLKDELLLTYTDYDRNQRNGFESEQLKKIWKTLIFEDYLKSESTYFRQIFMNTIHQALFKDQILKVTNKSGYFHLIGGLDNISHLLPFYDLWEISRKIRADEGAYLFWSESGPQEINLLLKSDKVNYRIELLRAHIETFGYHSQKELDVTYPCYYEDTIALIHTLKETIALEDEYNPSHDKARLHLEFQQELQRIASKTSKRTYAKLHQKIENMRKMLWWREEFRDVSTRFYYIIRSYTLLLAKQLVKEQVLKSEDEIWFTKIEDVRNFLDGHLSTSQIQAIIHKNQEYYQSFRNYTSENEIGHTFDASSCEPQKDGLCGIGCNSMSVTGTARIIEDLEHIDRLQPGDILVTKFTDTGWTSKFAILKGIVTEYGGILCHAAIVSREYGIPCVVCAEHATQKIPDGATITINGETGEIRIHEEVNN